MEEIKIETKIEQGNLSSQLVIPKPRKSSKRIFFIFITAILFLIASLSGTYFFYKKNKIKQAEEKDFKEMLAKKEQMEIDFAKKPFPGHKFSVPEFYLGEDLKKEDLPQNIVGILPETVKVFKIKKVFKNTTSGFYVIGTLAQNDIIKQGINIKKELEKKGWSVFTNINKSDLSTSQFGKDEWEGQILFRIDKLSGFEELTFELYVWKK